MSDSTQAVANQIHPFEYQTHLVITILSEGPAGQGLPVEQEKSDFLQQERSSNGSIKVLLL